MSGKHSTLTRVELAAELSKDGRRVTPLNVTKWLEDGLPVAIRGKGGRPSRYRLADVRAWLDARDQAPAASASDFQAARIRKELAQAAEAEQRVAQRAGRLLAVEDVEKTWTSMVAAARARLLALPTSLADRLCRLAVTDGVAAVEAELERAVYEALRELAGGEVEKKPTRKTTKSRKGAKRSGGNLRTSTR